MGKKGKEPAGLRRWRLAHRKKGGRKMAGRKKSRGRARTAYRRVAGFFRRHKWTVPSIAGGVLLLAAARRFGWGTAMSQAMTGNYTGALSTLTNNANVGNLIPIAAGGIALTVARGIVGPVPLTKVGKWQLRAL